MPESSERWSLETLPGTVRIGLIELNRAPIYGDWNAGIGCRRCAVGWEKIWWVTENDGPRVLSPCDEAASSGWRADLG